MPTSATPSRSLPTSRCLPSLPRFRSRSHGHGQARGKPSLARLCVPADLDGGGANRLGSDVDLRCDAPKGGTAGFVRTTVTTTDRFGTLTLKLIKPDSQYFPALEGRQ